MPTPLLSWRRGADIFYAGVTDSGEDVGINFKLKPRDIGFKDIECLVSDDGSFMMELEIRFYNITPVFLIFGYVYID